MEVSPNMVSLAPGLAIAAAAASCGILAPAARRIGWVDKPAKRKPHAGDVPLVGGVAVLLAFAVCWGLVQPPGSVPGWFELCAAIMFVTGLLDDRFHLSSSLRLGVQAIVGLAMVLGAGVSLTDLGMLIPGDRLQLGPWSVFVTVFGTVGLINAFNMIDGMDGLAGSLFLVMAGALALCASHAGSGDSLLLLLLIGAVLGFLLLNARLPWNPRARVFLGDAGSMALGFALAWFSVSLSQGSERSLAPITAVWICAVPLLDAASLIVRRFQAGRLPLHGDLQHLHHLFLRAGFRVSETCGLIMLAAALFAALGVGAEWLGVPESLSFIAFLGVALGYHRLVAGAWKSGQFLGRPLSDLCGPTAADSPTGS